MTESKTSTFLDQLEFPKDLKNLSQEDFDVLAQEIRDRLVDIGEKCGGHLGSNLGVVELTIALHTIFDSPKDKFVWDVSHQTYVHKMLTGRLDRMYTIRQDNGLSGFAKIEESEHDMFGAGHASTSISAALGMAQARDVKNEDNSVVAIIGDSSLPGGMAFEALNNIGKLKKDKNFICILNDNNMSISHPVGMMSEYITKIRTSSIYNTAKDQFDRLFNRIPKIGKPLASRIDSLIDRTRGVVANLKLGVLFEEFGFKYLGPIDGHNLPMLMGALKFAKEYPGPIMLHINTVKGKGHKEAEADPVKFHGVSPKKGGPAVANLTVKQPKYTEVFGKKMVSLAKDNPDIYVVTPAMETGSGLVEFSKAFPDRYCDVGIAEEHAVTFCAGMAQQGLRPVLAVYSTFLQRGYDQLVHDVCLQKLPVIFALDRAGLVGEDGPTHHGVFDYCYMLPLPNLIILAPKDGDELEAMLAWSLKQDYPVSIRFSKSEIPPQNGLKRSTLKLAQAEVLLDHPSKDDQYDILLIGVGSMAWDACEAAQTLFNNGLSVAALNLRFVKPLDIETITKYAKKAKEIFVVEEGNGIGGVFSHILSTISTDQKLTQWHSIAIPDEFVDHGKLSTLKNQYYLSKEGILKHIQHTLNLTLERTQDDDTQL